MKNLLEEAVKKKKKKKKRDPVTISYLDKSKKICNFGSDTA